VKRLVSVCVFFLLLSLPGVSPVFISGAAMPKTAFGLDVLVYLLACTQHALGPRLESPDSSEHPHALRF